MYDIMLDWYAYSEDNTSFYYVMCVIQDCFLSLKALLSSIYSD